MSILNALTRGYDNVPTQEGLGKTAIPRTLREEIQDRIKFHEEAAQRHKDALEALTPDVEKALNALQRLSY